MPAMRLRVPEGLLVILLTVSAASAGEIPTDPILRLEAGVHTAAINKAAVTGDGRLLTVSDDKTARLWNAQGGIPLTLRVPIGPGDEGALFAVAASPTKVRRSSPGARGSRGTEPTRFMAWNSTLAGSPGASRVCPGPCIRCPIQRTAAISPPAPGPACSWCTISSGLKSRPRTARPAVSRPARS
jgi:hypothetical protein